ncbi:MAG: HEAT repeat domain-containing protein [Planctomycetes bacterium]|nr:HEAT repeat domain-containing protein [Planctomycetota bacterium]
MRSAWGIGVSFVLAAGVLAAGEDWPEAAKKGFEAACPEATIRESKAKSRDGGAVYEVKATDRLNQGEAFKVVVRADGTILEEEQRRFAPAQVPEAVQAAFRTWAGDAAGTGAWEVKREGGKGRVFEVRKRYNGSEKKYEARFGEDGGWLGGDEFPGGGAPAATPPAAPAPAGEAARPGAAKAEPAQAVPAPAEAAVTEEPADPDMVRKVKRLIRATLEEEKEARDAAWKELREMGNLIVPGLVALFRAEGTTDDEVRSILIALGDSKDPRSGPALVEVLEHKNPKIRRDAARALGNSKYKAAVPALAKHFDAAGEDEDVRLYAAIAAAQLGSDTGYGALKALMGSEQEAVRTRAVFALGQHGGKARAADVALALKDSSPMVRKDAADILRRMKAETVTGALVEACGDEDYKVRAEIVKALKELTGQSHDTPEDWKKWWSEKQGGAKTDAAAPVEKKNEAKIEMSDEARKKLKDVRTSE